MFKMNPVQHQIYACPINPKPFPWPWSERPGCDPLPLPWSAEMGTTETDVVGAAVGPIQECPDGPTHPYPDTPDECRLGTVGSYEMANLDDTGGMETSLESHFA